MQAWAGDERREALWLPFGAAVERPAQLPGPAELRAGLAGVVAGRVRLRVTVTRPSPWPWESPRDFEWAGDLVPGEWSGLRLPLAGLPAGPVRLSFEARADGAAQPCLGGVVLGQPALVASPGARPARPNVVLVSFDALRADRVGRAMPRLAAWAAARATSFSQARSVAPWTLPAHASLLSGLSPLRHGANWPYLALAGDVPLVARELRRSGYFTAAAVGGGWLEPAWGLARGFERHRSWSRPGLGAEEWQAHAALAARWLDDLPQPFFLFLHTFDVHDFPRRERLQAGQDDDRRRELYDQAAAHADAAAGPLLERLGQAPWRDSTVVVVTSDHGEALGEGGAYGHGALSEEVLRIPLLLALPGAPGGGRDERPAQLTDVAATLLDLAGSPSPVALDGRSLRGPAPVPRPAVAYFHLEGQGLLLRSGRLAYRVDDSAFAGGARREECHDLTTGERRALAPSGDECAGLRATARAGLAKLPGLALRLERAAGAPAELELRGRAMVARLARGWSEGQPLLVASGPGAARVRWPADGRVQLTLAALPGALLWLEAGGLKLVIDATRAPLPLRWGFGRDAWRARDAGPCPPGQLCVEVDRQGELALPAVAPLADPALRERLRALGYVN